MITESIDTESREHRALRVLRLYHLYRLTVGLALVVLTATELNRNLLDLSQETTYQYVSWSYLAINLVLAFVIRKPHKRAQIFAVALFDISMLLVMFYAASGAASGIGNFIVIAVAIANSLLRLRFGLILAAIAAIGMLYITIYLGFAFPDRSTFYLQAGSLGALGFSLAILVQVMTRRLRVTEELAERRGEDLADLQALNALIIERMRTGIMVLDDELDILLANQHARIALGEERLEGKNVDQLFPELVPQIDRWKQNPALRQSSLSAPASGLTLQPAFIALQRSGADQILVFLEDASRVTQQAQQMKLASLGRLTASIAHEIRNPLGAISHAAQLLQESEELDDADRRLTQIIQQHSRRMNHIIEDILQLSRRRKSLPQLIDLKYWLHRYAAEFRETAKSDQTLHIQTEGSSLLTRMDANQLTQVINNLVQNGLRYSEQKNGTAQVWLRLYRNVKSELPVLDVIDDGPGVSSQQLQNLFEPFFTTESQGNGLGLYISRELCESNQARLDHQPREEGGTCFRITFAHPQKQTETE
ncbi:sensor histidine kinase [Pseudomonas matsuisoli]|uniref:histidine kinase n=1 Tax=Pseudomonas matsuisoli TaxID=1515666 RepID=A0A917UZ46_9PSED|nr:ATP-binding protein [Pseudomonas matsuisoli]GGK01693.1 PAS domain-containing sensor histidine kinase [Pseudomonas matsuisoli]